ncbi:MAG: metal ABC transporter substrate-binding protein [Candidatus Anstonellales archaeon]
MKKLLALPLAALLLLGCIEAGKPKVAVTLYAYGHMAERIGGGRVQVVYLLPEGSSEHITEPSPSKLFEAQGSQLLIYNGEIDEWATGVDARKKLRMYDYAGGGNPHIWLDPVLMQSLAAKVKEALIEIDPEGEAIYEANAESYINELKLLDEYARGRKMPAKAFEMHPGFSRFGERYGISIIPIERVEGEEVSGSRILELVKLAKEESITIFIVERYRDPSEAQAIAEEMGARLVVLDTLAWVSDDDRREGRDYFYIMRSNIDKLSG